MGFVRFFTLVCVNSFLVLPVSAQDSNEDGKASDTKSMDFTKGPGIEVGKELPEIKLMNQDGEEVSVHKMLKSGSAALVFFRSAGW